MKRTDEILFQLLRRALGGHSADKLQEMPEQLGHDPLKQINDSEWKEIYHQASYQGVLGVLWDGVKDLPMDKGLRLNWALNVEKIEQRYEEEDNKKVGFFGRIFGKK
jgi:hypothetical protein